MLSVLLNHRTFSKILASLLLFGLSWIPVSGFAQEKENENKAPISVEVYVNPAKATIGDIVTYTIRLRHDDTIEPYPPKYVPPVGLEAVDQGTRKLPAKDTQKEQEFWFRLRADRVGSFEFPPISLAFEVTREGSEKIPGQIMTPKAELEVQSILRLEGEPTDIRDIKSLEDIGRNWWPWVLGALAAITIIAGVILYLRRKGKPKTELTTIVEKKLTPQELAFQELEALVAKELLEKGMVREYYFELSEIFRRYLGGRYEFQALDWTTEEIKHHLLHSPALEIQYSGKIINILEVTDLVKFAKAPAPREGNILEEIILMIQATSKIVETNPFLNNTPARS